MHPLEKLVWLELLQAFCSSYLLHAMVGVSPSAPHVEA